MTGPTGSGKTLTLYSGLRHLNNEQSNIITVEDPVEIRLRGANQIAVNKKLGLGFAQILRALMRQDPDVIMVGEIRDFETATAAIRAAKPGIWFYRRSTPAPPAVLLPASPDGHQTL